MRMDADGVTGTTASYMVVIDEGGSAHADVEDLDELEGVDGGLLNAGVCEVEVEGAIHEIEGDEEGLITTNPTNYVGAERSSSRGWPGRVLPRICPRPTLPHELFLRTIFQ